MDVHVVDIAGVLPFLGVLFFWTSISTLCWTAAPRRFGR